MTDATYEGPDRRAQGVALVEAVGSLDSSVNEMTREASAMRGELNTEKIWRRVLAGAFMLLAVVVIGGFGLLWNYASTNRATINSVTSPQARKVQAAAQAAIVCDLKADLREAVGAKPPACTTTTIATIPR